MKKLLFLLLLFGCFCAKSQIGYEDYYSEKDLLANMREAKTTAEQLDAAGVLAVHYKGMAKDSLASLYLNKVYQIAKNGKEVRLAARAIWWDHIYEADTLKANKLLQLALRHNLLEEKIIAFGLLSEYYIHHKLGPAETNALTANKLLDSWKKDTTRKDSLRLIIYNALAHVYIHKNDGVNSSRYLLALQDYAQGKNESLKIQAIDILGGMYSEWLPQKEKATEWMIRAYEFYKKKGKKNELLEITWSLGMQYRQLKDTMRAKLFFKEADGLIHSLGAYGHFQIWMAWNKLGIGGFDREQFLLLLDNNFNNRLRLSPKEHVQTKAKLFSYLNEYDSAKYYLLQYKKLVGDKVATREYEFNYMLNMIYFKQKEYQNALALLKEYKSYAEEEADINHIQWVYRALSRSYTAVKDYKNANEWLVKAHSLGDSLDALNNEAEVATMQMQKRQEIREATFKAETASVAYRNKVRLYALLSGILALLIIAGILWRNNRQSRKNKLEIEHAYNELKDTQAQLIQSEKMASLGELTGGIAHEIQNPLNFVNNFSEVSNELIDEMMEEVAKGNYDEVKAIADDVKQNLSKINHHGRRADGIVKGMLQHSRSSTGQKEPTNINVLADEYLRLAYHGLRAKDKSFNATLKTDYDESIGDINIIPQDIGRVILNLITNAFYAVAQKKKDSPDDYEPTITVRTELLGHHSGGLRALIAVTDNGNGIPQNVLDKIFQPFFTTKPTGQGTGLGLSLSYDIVKAHGGEITGKSGEGKGATFTLLIPFNP